MVVATQTVRPKSVRNRCVIELFGGVFGLSLFPFDISVDIRAESDIFRVAVVVIAFLSV